MHTHRYIHIHHIQFLIIHLFRIPSQTIPTYYSRTMNMALRLISLSCHIDTNPFHVSCQTHTNLIISIPWIISYIYHAHLMLKLINHNSYTISFIKVIQFIFLEVIAIQAYCQYLESRKASRLTTFSPSFSLRQKGLAQARDSHSVEPPSLRRGLEKGSRSSCGISLRRGLSRLGESLRREWDQSFVF